MRLTWLIGERITMAATLARKKLVGDDHRFSDTHSVSSLTDGHTGRKSLKPTQNPTAAQSAV